MNFDKILVQWFGEKTSLQKNLSFAIQFAKLNLHQASNIQNFNIPPAIEALDLRLNTKISDELANDPQYKLKVLFALLSGGKSSEHIEFISPESAQGKEIHNILIKEKTILTSDEYPFKTKAIVDIIKGKLSWFSIYYHTKAWKKFKIRPETKSNTPRKTQSKYCIYDAAHKDYLYNQKWAEFLLKTITSKDDLK
ncbi:hypothetical protein FAI40_02260 [Acetobacteraceae bacterium]|nr:hypothetical protein FAI40_02260 [Acetobacteraceae bacterium]